MCSKEFAYEFEQAFKNFVLLGEIHKGFAFELQSSFLIYGVNGKFRISPKDFQSLQLRSDVKLSTKRGKHLSVFIRDGVIWENPDPLAGYGAAQRPSNGRGRVRWICGKRVLSKPQLARCPTVLAVHRSSFCWFWQVLSMAAVMRRLFGSPLFLNGPIYLLQLWMLMAAGFYFWT